MGIHSTSRLFFMEWRNLFFYKLFEKWENIICNKSGVRKLFLLKVKKYLTINLKRYFL